MSMSIINQTVDTNDPEDAPEAPAEMPSHAEVTANEANQPGGDEATTKEGKNIKEK